MPPARDDEAFGPGPVTIVNDSDLPDLTVQDAVETYFAEDASLTGIATSFRLHEGRGGLFGRSRWGLPEDPIEEMRVARDLAERDDSVGAAIGQMCAIAFGGGMENFSRDEQTAGFFNEVAREVNLDLVWQEMYRELLITSSVTTVELYTRKLLSFTPANADTPVQKQVTMPRVGIIPAENIRVIDDDTFGLAPLWFVPCERKQREWLERYFNPTTSVAVKAELRRQNPVWANLFTEARQITNDEDFLDDYLWAYALNPNMVQRTTFPKGADRYPRPLLTGNLALLEAKRLLNVMDHALLQGGTNYIVIAKKGSKEQPAKPKEITGLYNTIRSASRTGVLVGDHRLSLEIVTPNLESLLNPEKRSLLDRKLAMRLQRLTEASSPEPGVAGATGDQAVLEHVVTSDRLLLKRHGQRIYERIVKRNPTLFKQGTPSVWFPKVVLTGQDVFNNMILKLRDRGDIPRRWVVEAAGFDYEASVEQRRAEIENGDDEVLAPAGVPFTGTDGTEPAPPGAPVDNSGGRPPGSSPDNGAPRARQGTRQTAPTPTRQLQRTRGETVRAWWDEEEDAVQRVGETTFGVLAEFPQRTVGRMSEFEREAIESGRSGQQGPLIVVAVNPGYTTEEHRAVRLESGVSMLVGRRRRDHALVAKALCFRDTRYTVAEAEERAMRWGFPVAIEQEPEDGD